MEHIKKSPVSSKTLTRKSHNKENYMLIEELQYLVTLRFCNPIWIYGM